MFLPMLLAVAPVALAQDDTTQSRAGVLAADVQDDLESLQREAEVQLDRAFQMLSRVDMKETDTGATDWAYRTSVKSTSAKTNLYQQVGVRVDGGAFTQLDLEAGGNLTKDGSPVIAAWTLAGGLQPEAWSLTPLLVAAVGGPAEDIKGFSLVALTGLATGCAYDDSECGLVAGVPLYGAVQFDLDAFNRLAFSSSSFIPAEGDISAPGLGASYRRAFGEKNKHILIGKVDTKTEDWAATVGFEYRYVLAYRKR